MGIENQERYVRRFATFLLVLEPIYLAGFWVAGYRTLCGVLVWTMLGYGSVVALTWTRWARSARWLLLVVMNYGLLAFAAAAGPYSGIDFLFFTFTIVPFLVFEERQRRAQIFWAIASLGLFVLTPFSRTHIFGLPNLSFEQQNAIRPALVVGSGIVQLFLVALILRQTSERRRHLESLISKLVDREAKLVRSSRLSALGEIAVGISHELKNPLSSLLLRSRLARKQLEASDLAPVKESIERIENDGNRMGRIIDGMSKAGRSSEKDPFVPVKLERVFYETQELCHARLSSTHVRMTFTSDSDLEIECREAEIVQILVNLINNAFDAVQPLDEKWIHVEGRRKGNEIFISVTDSGSGIPDSVVKKMMEPFFTTKEGEHGTGIGLSISRSIAEEHGGSVFVDASAPNTRIVLRLPAKS